MLFQTNLVVGLGVHEMVSLIVVVEKRVLTSLNTYGVNFVSRIKCVIDDLPCFDIFQFGTHKGSTLSRFDVQEFDDLPQTVVVVQNHAVFDVARVGHAAILRVR